MTSTSSFSSCSSFSSPTFQCHMLIVPFSKPSHYSTHHIHYRPRLYSSSSNSTPKPFPAIGSVPSNACTTSTSKNKSPPTTHTSLRRPRPTTRPLSRPQPHAYNTKNTHNHNKPKKLSSILPPPPEPPLVPSNEHQHQHQHQHQQQHERQEQPQNLLVIGKQQQDVVHRTSKNKKQVEEKEQKHKHKLEHEQEHEHEHIHKHIKKQYEYERYYMKQKGIFFQLRKLILGKYAMLKEFRLMNRISSKNIAMTRGIVIFADYLADLSVLDLLSDLNEYNLSIKSIVLTLTGLSFGIYIADFITGIFNYIQIYNWISIFPHAHYENDVFHKLVNSCFLIIPFLSVAVSWAHESNNLFIQSTLVSALALVALAPLLHSNNNGFIVHTLRRIGFLKQYGQPGWSQICGVSEELLTACIPVLNICTTWMANKWNMKHWDRFP